MRKPVLLAISLLLCAKAPAQIDAALQKQVDSLVAAHHGDVALYARQLNTGKTIEVKPDLPVQTASTIKLTLLWEAMRQVALGTARWDEHITIKPDDLVGGSGMLHFFDAPMQITLKDATTMMVIVSDNTATNLMIDRFPVATVDQDMAALGLDQTVLYKKVFKPATGPMPADQPRFGLGKTTPKQIATLMEKIGRCDLDLPGKPAVDHGKAEAACTVGLTMLRNQFYRDTVPRYVDLMNSGPDSAIASKTGSLDATRSDIAIVAAKTGPIVLAVYTFNNKDKSWTVDNEGERTIAAIAKAIVTAWSPDGTDGKLLKPGLGR